MRRIERIFLYFRNLFNLANLCSKIISIAGSGAASVRCGAVQSNPFASEDAHSTA